MATTDFGRQAGTPDDQHGESARFKFVDAKEFDRSGSQQTEIDREFNEIARSLAVAGASATANTAVDADTAARDARRSDREQIRGDQHHGDLIARAAARDGRTVAGEIRRPASRRTQLVVAAAGVALVLAFGLPKVLEGSPEDSVAQGTNPDHTAAPSETHGHIRILEGDPKVDAVERAARTILTMAGREVAGDPKPLPGTVTMETKAIFKYNDLSQADTRQLQPGTLLKTSRHEELVATMRDQAADARETGGAIAGAATDASASGH